MERVKLDLPQLKTEADINAWLAQVSEEELDRLFEDEYSKDLGEQARLRAVFERAKDDLLQRQEEESCQREISTRRAAD